jgi:membrane-associated phospholipid phosphatase
MSSSSENVLQPPRRAGREVAIAAAILAVAVLLYFLADVQIAAWCHPRKGHMPSFFRSFFDGAKFFGQIYTALAAFFLILLMDPKRRRGAIQFAIALLVTSLVVDLVKIIGRVRPDAYLAAIQQGVPAYLDNGAMWQLFKGIGRTNFNSLPSAHAASAFAMAGALYYLYPKGAWVFFLSAILCGVSRVLDVVHYPSDVLIGAAIGLWVAYDAFHRPFTARLSDSIARQLFPLNATPE